MEGLLILLGLVVIAIPIAVIVLIFGQIRLRREVRVLREQVALLYRDQATDPATPRTTTTPPAPANTPRPVGVQGSYAPPPPKEAKPELAAVSSDGVTQAEGQPWKSAGTMSIPDPEEAEGAAVFRSDRFAALSAWFRENWFYAAAAVSLALAGIFLVQYGVETGLLTPPARVAAALAFGALLIGGGEWIRRRFGDDADSTSAYLPSVLSGAGLVSVMGAVLAARLLYGLIDPGPALLALFATALFGLALGWMHGPLLAAIGLIGGMTAPFFVGGSSETPEWLLLYFALLVALGLGIDTLRRWAWISVLSLVLGFGAGWALVLGLPSNMVLLASFAAYSGGLAILATLIPARAIVPDHIAPSVIESFLKYDSGTGWPIFPARLSFGAIIAASGPLLYAALGGPELWWASLVLASALILLFTLWSQNAPGLQDHVIPPAATLLLLILAPDLSGPVLDAMISGLVAQEGQTETRMPWDVTLVVIAALLPSLAAFRQSLLTKRYPALWAAGAVLFAPLAGLVLELAWQPALRIGAWPWALHGLGLAAVMTYMAERFVRADGDDRVRASLATLSALACLAFGLSVVLTSAALTIALAATVAAAAWLDRRFDLPLMGWYIAAGIIALGVRLTFDPGLDWAINVSVMDMLAAYGGTLIAMIAGLWLIAPRARQSATVFLESAAWSVGGMTVSLTLHHVIKAFAVGSFVDTHWNFGLHAVIWTGVALAQIQRMGLGGALTWVRTALAAIFGLLGLGAFLLAATFFNPLIDNAPVLGPAIFNTLIPAYLLPALVVALALTRLEMHKAVRIGLSLASLVAAILWVGLTIRHGWRGAEGMRIETGVSQSELYSYTVALLLVGVGLFYQALARRTDGLRRAGVAVIGLAVAKVFLIDISGLEGLVRVFSFLLLGLSLAGLAWFNRWVQTRATAQPEQAPSP